MMRFLSLYKIGLKYPIWTLLFCLSLGVGSFFLAKKLNVITDFSTLLPEQTSSVQNLELLEEKFGSLGYLVLTVEGPDAASTEAFGDQFAKKLAELDEVRYVDHRKPIDYFLKRKWLFVSLEDLKEMDQRIDRSLELQKEGVSPVFSDLMDFADVEDRPDLSFADIEAKYQEKIGKENTEISTGNEGKFLVLKARIHHGPGDIEKNRQLIAKVKVIERELKTEEPFQQVQVGYTGTYQVSIETVQAISQEMTWISIAVTILLLLILILYFRFTSSAILVGLPLLVGITWTGALVYLVFEHVNIITAFGVSILGGLGSDYGIYLLSRFAKEAKSGATFASACQKSFANTGKATLMAMLTTVGAFGSLTLSGFEMFVEFGFVGATGLALNFLSMMLMMPGMLKLLHRYRPGLLQRLEAKGSHSRPWTQIFQPKMAGVVLVPIAMLIAISSLTVKSQSKIYIEEGQMDNRSLPSNQLYDRVSKFLGESLHPTVLLAQGARQDRQAVKKLDQLLEESAKENLVFNKVMGLSHFIPENQAEKRELLKVIAKKYPLNRFVNPDQKRIFLTSVEDTLNSKEITEQSLPVEITRNFISKNDPEWRAIYLFPRTKREASEAMTAYNQGIREAKTYSQTDLKEVGGSFVSEDIINLIQEEAPRGLLLILGFFSLVLYLALRKLKRSALILTHLLGAMVVLSGVLYLLDIKLNILNIAVFPIILGTGIDCFIHFSQYFDEVGSLKKTVEDEVPAILISNLTSIVGFGGLMFSSDTGLRSIGYVSVIGLVVVTLFCVIVFPRSLSYSFLASSYKSTVEKKANGLNIPRRASESTD